MSATELGFLLLVLGALGVFGGMLAYMSWFAGGRPLPARKTRAPAARNEARLAANSRTLQSR